MANVFIFDSSDVGTNVVQFSASIGADNAVYIADFTRNHYFDTGVQVGDTSSSSGPVESWS